jgi:ribA/ribD-fused uncharacterized protein
MRFRGKYNFLSNFYPCEVEFEGKVYPSVEHAFQAGKTLNEAQREEIRCCGSPSLAKKLGRRVTLRKDWEKEKLLVMASCLGEKFFKDKALAARLKRVEGEIVEDNYWHDNFWGRCGCNKCGGKGENMLGKMLMYLKSKL